MAVSNAKTICLLAVVLLSLRASETPAAAPRARTEPIVLDAQSADAGFAAALAGVDHDYLRVVHWLPPPC